MDTKLYRLGWVLAAGLFLNAAGLLMPYLPIRPAYAQAQNAAPAPVYLVTPAGRPLTIMEQNVKDTLGRNQLGFGLMITTPHENPLPIFTYVKNRQGETVPATLPLSVQEHNYRR